MKKQNRLFAFLASVITAITSLTMTPLSASAEANSIYQQLYRCSFYVPENTYPVKINANNLYNPAEVRYYNHGTDCVGLNFIGGTFNVSNVEITDSQEITYINYVSSSPSKEAGYIGFVDFLAYSEPPQFTITSIKNDRGNNLALNTVSVNFNIMGDVNADDIVNINDYHLLSKAIAGTYEPTVQGMINADMNGDGKIDFKDSNLLINLLQGRL